MAGRNYAKGVPMGDNMIPFTTDAPPAVKAIATTIKDTTATVSSVLNLNVNTTALEVAVDGGPAYIKWLTQATVDSSVAGTSVISTGAASFDHCIPDDTYRRFVIPIATIPTSYSSFQGANPANGLYSHLAIKGGTGASVIAITQYGSSNGY